MKSDRQTYIADRPPACQRDIGLAGRAGPQEVHEPMGSGPPKNRSARLIEYNDLMRHEERRYSRLLTELKKARWFIQSSPPLGKLTAGFSESDVGEFIRRLFGGPPGAECDVGRMLGELVSSELETTRLTDSEVRNDSCLTMEGKGFQLC